MGFRDRIKKVRGRFSKSSEDQPKALDWRSRKIKPTSVSEWKKQQEEASAAASTSTESTQPVAQPPAPETPAPAPAETVSESSTVETQETQHTAETQETQLTAETQETQLTAETQEAPAPSMNFGGWPAPTAGLDGWPAPQAGLDSGSDDSVKSAAPAPRKEFNVAFKSPDGKLKGRFTVDPGEYVLDAASRAGFDLPYSCRNGGCFTCGAKFLKGTGTMHDQYVMEQAQMDEGFVLLCCCTLEEDVELLTHQEEECSV